MTNHNRCNPRPDGPTATRSEASAPEDAPVVSFECFEPNSLRLSMGEEDLVRHTLFLGTTGSGKTTTMNRMIHDLIHHRAADPQRKMGLLVVDSKRDDTVAKVQAWAAAAGRAEDVVVFEPGSNWGYHPLLELTDFKNLESAAAKLTSAARYMGSDNGFFTDAVERYLDMALTILVTVEPGATWESASAFLNGLLLNVSGQPAAVDARLEQFEKLVKEVGPKLEPALRLKLESAQMSVNTWKGMGGGDTRLKNSVVACLANALTPLHSLVAQDYFAINGRQAFDLGEIVRSGKILVLSLDAAGNPELAKLLIKLVKADFFRTLQARRLAPNSAERLAGIILDEYPLAVTAGEGRFSDITQLQTIRSKRGFMVAATQGFISLDMVVGAPAREALLVNFNNLFFFNSHETQVQLFVLPLFGEQPVRSRTRVKLEQRDLGGEGGVATQQHSLEMERSEFVCPPGRLSQLETGQAFVTLARGGSPKHPVWLVPLYFGAAVETAPVKAADPARSLIAEFLARKPVAEDFQPPIGGELPFPKPAALPFETLMPAGVNQPVESQPDASGSEQSDPAVKAREPKPFEVLLTPREALQLRGPNGLLVRLSRMDEEFARQVTIRPGDTKADGTKVYALCIPSSQMHKLNQLPAMTSADAELLEFLRKHHALPEANTGQRP